MAGELSKLYRVPRISINLPSGAGYYQAGEIEFSMDGSLPIRAMTAKDELMLKSPDALLNGDCLVHIIRSCVPEITNPKKILAPDIEAILLGIFYASYGPKISFKAECPECKHENTFEVEIRGLLDSVTRLPLPAKIEADLGVQENIPTKIVTYVRPYSFETNTRHQLELFEHSKMLQIMGDDKSNDEEKLKVFNSCFEKIVQIKFDNVVNCVDKIEIHREINKEWAISTIESAEEIKDFIFNADSSLIEPIMEKVDQLNESGIKNDFQAKCSKCSHEWETKVEFNPVNFFVKSSSHSSRLKL